MRKGLMIFAGICLAAGLSGCGMHVEEVKLKVPEPDVYGGTFSPVVVDAVTDARDLTKAPSSMGNRVDARMLKELGPERASALIAGGGNSQNAFAVILADGKNVSDIVAELISNAMKGHGYKPVNPSSEYNNAPHVKVRIDQFFVYQPFSFFRALTWTMQMKADIATDIEIDKSGERRSIHVEGHGANIVQSNKPENYVETYSAAMDDYMRNFARLVLRELQKE